MVGSTWYVVRGRSNENGYRFSSVQNLEIWQDAMERLKTVYALTKTRPKDEPYGLISQARRAAVSANLAEGMGREAPKEMARFAQVALGSLYELEMLL